MKTKGVACPVCGYDLRGVVASWTDSCPLEGTCSECGHVFDWSFLLSRRQRDQMEPFDCATRLRGYSFVYTLFVLLRPWRLWGLAGRAPSFSLRRSVGVSAAAFVFWATAVATVTQLFAVVLYPLVHAVWPEDEVPGEWIYPAAWVYGVWDEGALLALVSWGILGGLVFLVVATISMPLLTWMSSRTVLGIRDTARITAFTLAGFPVALLPGALMGIVHEAAWDIYWDVDVRAVEDTLGGVLGVYEFLRGALDTVALSLWISVCWLVALRRGHGVREVLSQVVLLSMALIVLLFFGALAFITVEYLLV